MKSLFDFMTGPSKSSSSSSSNQSKFQNIYNLFADKLKIECSETGGPFLFFSNGSLYEYLRDIEDSVILYIILSKYNLHRSASLFEEKIVSSNENHFSSLVNMVVYSNNPINRIRVCIRIFFINSLDTVFKEIDTVLHGLGNEFGEPSNQIKQLMIEKGRHLKAKIKNPFPYKFLPLIDDYIGNVFHLNMHQYNLIKLGIKETKKYTVAIKISKCGSDQINGEYILTSGETEYEKTEIGDKNDVCFTNQNGFQICRIERLVFENSVEKRVSSSSSSSSDHELLSLSSHFPSKIYDWFVLNPLLSSSYYGCTSLYNSKLPPMRYIIYY